MKTNIPQNSRRALILACASAFILAACGGGGSSGDVNIPGADSITITSLNGPSGGTVGSPVSLNVKVLTTGGIDASEISYTWEQTAGPAVASKTQGDGNYESTLTFTAAVPGDVTFKVTASARGKTASQSKTTPIS